MVRIGECAGGEQHRLGGELGAVRVRQRHLDPCRFDLLVADIGPQLCVRGRRVHRLGRLPDPESMARGQRHGGQDQPDPGDWSGGGACWSRNRNQISFLRVSRPPCVLPLRDMVHGKLLTMWCSAGPAAKDLPKIPNGDEPEKGEKLIRALFGM